MTSKRVLQKAATRQRLLESAYALFAERGYSSVSIEDVASAAGISRVGFYLHFTGMLELATELMEPARQGILEHYQLLDQLAPTAENLRRWATDIVALWHRHAVRIGLLEAVMGTEPEAKGLWSANLTTVRNLMPRYTNGFAPGSARELATWRVISLMLTHERLCHLTVVADIELDPGLLVELLAEGCAAMLVRTPPQAHQTGSNRG